MDGKRHGTEGACRPFPAPSLQTIHPTPVPCTRNPAHSRFILGVDDTDSPRGLCTTYLATELIREFADYDLIGYPRLVRLNPNIPWKTRGNGAISLAFGRGSGRPFVAGRFENGEVPAFRRAAKSPIDLAAILERADRTVLANSASGESRTNPALFVGLSRPPERLYTDAVRELVRPSEVIRSLSTLRGIQWDWRTHRGIRGIVGASAAAAWRGRRRTYELIAYRERCRWGTPRKVDFASVIRMDRRYKTTFNNIDALNRHIVIAPHSPCPVLMGIRAFYPQELERAARAVRPGEDAGRQLLFLSNQGTDDHLQKMTVSEIRPYVSPVISGNVTSAPWTGRGGHVFFSLGDGSGWLDCAAYEPTKQFRAIVRGLLPGDKVEAAGGVHARPFTLNLEKLRLRRLARAVKLCKPKCPTCGRSMKSVGRAGGYRCRRCRTRAAAGSAIREHIERSARPGLYEVPKCARRHLSRPLSR